MKSKRVLTILMSMAITLTFMPTLAFAHEDVAPADKDDSHAWDEDSAEVVDTFEGVLTGAEYEVSVVPCTNEKNGNVCEATYTTIALKGDEEHTYSGEPIGMTKAAYLERVASENGWDADTLEEAAEAVDGFCYVFVKECDTCGHLFVQLSNSPRTKNVHWVSHLKSDDDPECAYEYTCQYCGEKFINTDFEEDSHDFEETTTEEYVCGSENGGYGYTVTKYVCNDCGYTKYDTEWVGKEGTEPTHTGLGTAVTPASGKTSYYVQVGDDYYAPNEVVTEPGCETKGVAALRCEECDTLVGKCAIEATGHSWVSMEVEASCTAKGYTCEMCENCGDIRNVKYTDDALGHSYVVDVISEPSCDAAGLTIICCERCGNGDGDDFMTADEALDEELIVKENGKFYFVGFDKELSGSNRIEIADWSMLSHKWGQFETISEATCDYEEVVARKCSVCGHYNIEGAKTSGDALGHEYELVQTVAPTCGEYGYDLEKCTRCGDEQRTNETDPVVQEGAKCDFQWTVTKEMSIEDQQDGEKAKVCTVCGAVEKGTETVISWEEAKKEADEKAAQEAKEKAEKEAEAAKTAAEKALAQAKVAAYDAKIAAAAITESAYTTDSFKAVQAAVQAVDKAVIAGDTSAIQTATANLNTAVKAAELKAENGLTAAGKTIKAKKAKTKKFKASKAMTVSGAVGAVTYAKASGNKKITVNATTGKITVKKGLKKGKTYKVKVNVTAAGDGNTKAATKQVTVKVKVK